MLKKSNPQSYMVNISKNPKNYFLLHFDLVSWVWVLSNKVEDATFRQFFLINLYLFDSIFSGIVRIDQLHDFDEGICLLNSGCYGNGIKILLQLSKQQLQGG